MKVKCKESFEAGMEFMTSVIDFKLADIIGFETPLADWINEQIQEHVSHIRAGLQHDDLMFRGEMLTFGDDK